MQTATSWLSLAIWIPIGFGVAILAAGRDRNHDVIRTLALIGSLLGLVVTIPLYTGFDPSLAQLQFVENVAWIERLNANYHLGVDGISIWFVLLTAFMTVIAVLAGWQVIETRVSQYYAAFLILSGLMVGVFAAADGLLFFVFFEATLVPMYIIIGIWGGANRLYAAIKFFLYTFAGSLLMLVALVYLYYASDGRFGHFRLASDPSRHDGADAALSRVLRSVCGQGADVAGSHMAARRARRSADRWLDHSGRDHAEAWCVRLPALLAADCPDASHELAGFVIALSLIAVVYIGFVALVQSDMKKLVAYSSIAHMGFVTLGFFIFNPMGMTGGIVQMISHGFVSGAMFFCIGVMYDRMHSRDIADYGGVVNTMPKFAAFFMLFVMANAGLAGDQRICRRVHGDSRRRAVQLLDCADCRHDAGTRRRVLVVDVQASHFRRRCEQARRRSGRRQSPRVRDPYAARCFGVVDGAVSEARH